MDVLHFVAIVLVIMLLYIRRRLGYSFEVKIENLGGLDQKMFVTVLWPTPDRKREKRFLYIYGS